MFLSNTICVVLLFSVVDSARILGVFPMPSISHQYVFRALTMELAKRGHELVVVTPDPALPKDRPPDNITEIDVSFSYDVMRKMQAADMSMFKRGVMIDVETMINFEAFKDFMDIFFDQFKHPELQKILHDKNQKFDLILLEAYQGYHFIVTEMFKAPAILISSFHGVPESYETVGSVARHPILYPHFLRQRLENLSLLEKIQELFLEYRLMKHFQRIEDYENQMLKINFGIDTPSIAELKNNIDFLLINSNEIFCGNRPVTPNVAYVGPLHLQPLKPLPEELELYLNNSKTGVIYVSLGTNVRPSQMDEELLNTFLDTFEALPYDILWKFDGDNLKRLPKNVKVQKWFPQRDLLAHPNIKLFVTQAGLQSTDEAIDAGVPLVAIPMLGDQFFNAYKYEQLGIGVKLDVLTIDTNKFLGAIHKVLSNESYRIKIKSLKEVLNDQPLGPMERAVWWTEYVLRHGGARHFRSPAANISWSEYLMIDVIIALAAFALASLLAVVLLVRFILNLFRSKPAQKSKQS